MRTGSLAACILAIILFCIPSVHAYNMMEGSDWKWAYAQSNSEANITATGVRITDADIAFARGRVAAAEKDCANMGGVWCDWAKGDRETLQRLLRVQARQADNPSPAVVDMGPIPDLTNVIDSAWKQLQSISSQFETWLNGLVEALEFEP